MVKIVAGLMGASVASGSTSMSGVDQLRPFLTMLQKHKVRELDTARVYNKGRSPEDLGAIPGATNDFLVATKAPGFSPGSLSYQNIIDNCNASLVALKQHRIDLYYFHGPDRQTPLEESCRAIHELHTEGKIANFGVSNINPQEVESIYSICSEKGWLKPTVYQGGYNGLMRTGETSLFPTLRKLGIAFYAYSPLAGSFFSKSPAQLRDPASGSRMDQMKVFAQMYVNDFTLKLHENLTRTCEEAGLTLKEAELRWLMHHSILGDEDGVILGASSLKQKEENLQACEKGALPQNVVDGFEDMWLQYQKAGLAPPATL